jgi:transposase
LLIGKLAELAGAGVAVETVLEATGTYGDPWCALLRAQGLGVYRVSAKHVHDYQEIYDGVPSGHDAKSAAIVAKLHLEGRSRLWEPSDQRRADLRARTDMLDWVSEEAKCWQNRLEARLARHWPEVLELLTLKSVTLVKLLRVFGSPAAVVASSEAAAELMRRCSRGLIKQDTIARVLASARETIGVPTRESQREQLQRLARKLQQARKERRALRREVEQAVRTDETVGVIGQQVGLCTAAVLHATLGDLKQYGSVRALYHGAGMNLKVHSSGEPRQQPRLSITKRGSSTARRWLFLATLRWIRSDPIARAWYQRKVAHNGGVKLKGVIALMRKLLAGLYHVARGAELDSTRLFDVRRLALPAPTERA